jgi:hypothetical protein
VVEDNIINQTVLKRQLVKAGYECDGKPLSEDHVVDRQWRVTVSTHWKFLNGLTFQPMSS